MKEDSVEDDLVIEGEYMSEESMRDTLQWTESLSSTDQGSNVKRFGRSSPRLVHLFASLYA